VLELLADRRPLDALKILVPLAEAGDEHSITVLALLGNAGGSCDAFKPSTTFDTYRSVSGERVRARGAAREIVQRVDDWLAEEQLGPTPDELTACQESAAEFKKLTSTKLQTFSDTLGRSVQQLRGENESDVEIEYARKKLVPGDSDGQFQLAGTLLGKGTPASQKEALSLLEEAAKTLPAAKTQLARCMLQGCPTPASDPAEARTLLAAAALAGDSMALRMLSGPDDASQPDLDPTLPAVDRYVWSQFWRRLNEEGCFGGAQYVWWATLGSATRDPLTLSPADSAAAATRAADFVSANLPQTRHLLGCD
jgi:TPR repeat protein